MGQVDSRNALSLCGDGFTGTMRAAFIAVSGKDIDKTTIFDLFYGTLPNAPRI